MEYIFYYYWLFGTPSTAKGIRTEVGLIGDGPSPIEGAVWVITKEEFDGFLIDLAQRYPWPFPEGNDA